MTAWQDAPDASGLWWCRYREVGGVTLVAVGDVDRVGREAPVVPVPAWLRPVVDEVDAEIDGLAAKGRG